MGALRLVIVLVVAAASAVGLALVFRHMTSSRTSAAAAIMPRPRPEIRVLVAKHDLKIGAYLQPEDVTWQPWPQNAVNPAFITGGSADASLMDKAEAAIAGDPAVQSVTGSLVREAIVAHEPMSPRKLVKGGQGREHGARTGNAHQGTLTSLTLPPR